MKILSNGVFVSVVKGYFAGLKGVGMPLTLCVQLQEHTLMFNTAQWMMRQSHAGLSILLFGRPHLSSQSLRSDAEDDKNSLCSHA